MNLQNSACFAVTVVALAAGALTASADPGACPRDSKLLNGGPTAFGEGEGTWWGLVIGGLDDAGLTNDDQKLACLSNVFGVDFADLDEAKQFNLDLLSQDWD